MVARAVIGLILFSLTSSANAATILLRDYKAPKDEQQAAFNKIYLDGVKDGLIALQAILEYGGQQPFICFPKNLALTHEQAEDIMMREADKVADPDLLPIASLLVGGLKETFPCEEKH